MPVLALLVGACCGAPMRATEPDPTLQAPHPMQPQRADPPSHLAALDAEALQLPGPPLGPPSDAEARQMLQRVAPELLLGEAQERATLWATLPSARNATQHETLCSLVRMHRTRLSAGLANASAGLASSSQEDDNDALARFIESRSCSAVAAQTARAETGDGAASPRTNGDGGHAHIKATSLLIGSAPSGAINEDLIDWNATQRNNEKVFNESGLVTRWPVLGEWFRTAAGKWSWRFIEHPGLRKVMAEFKKSCLLQVCPGCVGAFRELTRDISTLLKDKEKSKPKPVVSVEAMNLLAAFRTADANGDGTLSGKEMEGILTHLKTKAQELGYTLGA